MPTLVVLRHAKADRPADVDIDDLDRPLLPRGRDDARAAGGWLRKHVGRPGLVVCSPAQRTVETVDALLPAYGDGGPPVVFEETLYEASRGDALRVVRGLDDDADLVLLVGHNPSVSELVTDLTGTAVRLRTCGLAVLRSPPPWADAPPGECELVTVHTPRA